MRRSTTTAAAAAVVLIPLLVGTAGSPALAAGSGSGSGSGSGDVTVTNTETVQARLSATGAVQEARVYDQLAFTGHGSATVENPVSTKGLRNLDGFGGYRVVDGRLVATVDVDGERRARTVSTYDRDLPLAVEVEYTLDGEPVQPGAVVGRSGTLGVHYTVTNTTGKTQDVTYDDGTGTEATASAKTVVPMIGQLVTVLPSTFTDVRSDEAGLAGDGRGGTRLQFQMTLFPPIGSATAEFGYTAQVRGAVVPPATLTSMPVSPLDYPSFKGGAESYRSGAQKGVDLTAGATQIDDSVLQLHDGAAQLLAGLLQLRDGAAELSAGLNDSAAPGAARLAAGAEQLDQGLAQARAKAPQLLDGLAQVDSGLALVDAGLVKMYGEIGALDQDPKVKELQAGITKLRTAAATLTGAVHQVRTGVAGAATSATKLSSGAVALGGQLQDAVTGLGGLRAGMNPALLPQYDYVVAQLSAGVPVLTDTTNPATIAGGASALASGLATAAGTLAMIECGLDSTSIPGTCDTSRPDVVHGLAAVDAGVSQLISGVITKVRAGVGDADDTRADNTLRGGVHSLQAGMDQLSAGGGTLASGLAQLGAGASRLDDGADELSAGIARAAEGSRALSDGLGSASEGAPKLVDGTQQLSDEGTSQVVASGQATAEDFGVKYAVLAAGAERAQSEGMAYGAPDGAVGATAYSIEIAGVDGAGATNIGRLVAAIALFAGGIGVATLARRRTS
ncbi:hypothetical protein CTKZ_15020 [Cellulomonas algicola]|uniref:Uncharacterized protein n=1 Tax=Cellulomonas algicola TaxID=2071633 RepID=A0A401UZH3_9CELL|nr:hypothetical protein [Cellulomonas algicola]GCD19940.1 hypothetical protein CTKZ_15020 [Cellulomonas algicola]